MSPPDPDQSSRISGFSWESVLQPDVFDDDAARAEQSNASPSPSDQAAEHSAEHTSAEFASDAAEPDEEFGVSLDSISLTMSPLSLDPLPSVSSSSRSSDPSTEVPVPPVLGDINFEMPPLHLRSSTHDVVQRRPREAAPDPSPKKLDVNLTGEWGLPDLATGQHLAIDPEADKRTTIELWGLPDPATGQHAVTEPSARHAAVRDDVRIAPLDIPYLTPSEPADAVEADPAASQSSSGSHSLPQDDVAADPSPTTDLPDIFALDGAADPAAAAGRSPVVPEYQPNQVHANRASTDEPQPTLSKKQRKEIAKLQKRQEKSTAKRQKSRSGAGGVALFFTLLVLVGLIVAAVVFGRPYLFPGEWEGSSKAYADEVQTVTGIEINDPVTVTRQTSQTYSVTMAEELVGEWQAELPMWRSLGLVNGAVDEPMVHEMVMKWTPAFYSPSRGEIIANDSLPPAAVDGAIAEAMAAAAIDEQSGWSGLINDDLPDASAMTRAQVMRAAREISAATPYGAAVSDRRIDVAEFLPPLLSYRVNAPIAFAELVPDSASLLDAVIGASSLEPAGDPVLIDGDTLVGSPQQFDRGFWYLVFASFVDARTAYSASNELVQSSVVTAVRGTTLCTYGTFSGMDVAGTTLLGDALGQWAANVPAEMSASFTVLEDGSMQLISCDPGEGFEVGARFGIARELTRWRLVELAAIEDPDGQTRTAEQQNESVSMVRDSQAAVALMGLPYDTSAEESARLARLAVVDTAAADDIATSVDTETPADEGSG